MIKYVKFVRKNSKQIVQQEYIVMSVVVNQLDLIIGPENIKKQF